MVYDLWNYRKYHPITSSTTLTGYQVMLKIYYGSGTDSGNTVYLDSKCNTDFSDIRFTNATGTTLPYWIEAKTDSSYADVWVKVDSITTTSGFYLFYGNAAATSESSGTNTFIFFDDFLGSSLDTNLWNATLVRTGSSTGTVSVSGGALTINQGADVDGGISLFTNNALASNQVAIRVKVNSRATGDTTFAQLRFAIGTNTSATTYGIYFDSNPSKICLLNGSGVGDPYISESFVSSTAGIYDGQLNVVNPQLYKNNSLACSGTGDPTDPVGNYLLISVLRKNTVGVIDYIIVRNTVTSTAEPTHGTWIVGEQMFGAGVGIGSPMMIGA